MSEKVVIRRNLIVKEKEIEFPSAANEQAFKASLAKTPLSSSLWVEEVEKRKIYTLAVRPADFNEFRRQLIARGLEFCPTTIFLFNTLLRTADEKIKFTIGGS